ncbi:aspartate--tRNA(Asn) ligase [Paenibacillus selenitireducens]|uniref:Aspartate--tRNA(Asp/Asn) ligase n=1 Tax=Paenibacillus selenitireducens TaxID=1324314 RepID=A0A1T2X5S5_9BACL|nr:aspartate--tRNA(Asn) ligase [Paenibacillus selenitireducens]OPA75251.1 aspartate--tRNA(Asn) ligase [Paenibacillus selenitireducens]
MDRINYAQDIVKPLNMVTGPNGEVQISGFIHKIRVMSGFSFVILRVNGSLVQCVMNESMGQELQDHVIEGNTVSIEGQLRKEERAPHGFEIEIHALHVLSKSAEHPPIVINRKNMSLSLDTNLNYRSISLRHPKEAAIFKIQEGIVRGFRDFLHKNHFTEVRTPKIVFAGAEGGANIFKLNYFEQEVFLAQSPQFYKQALVGVYDRVFEVGPVYRAEKHNTSRHLNEYTSLDFEMGYIHDFTDIMKMEVGFLKYMFELLKEEYADQIKLLDVDIPHVDSIPALKFLEVKKIIEEKYQRIPTDYDDLDPEEEQLICDYVKQEYGSEFVFVTHFPSDKRPFYAQDDPNSPQFTLSFDLLFRGLEVTTGGQRIHDYHDQIYKMRQKGMNVDDFESYLMSHKYGIPPHGGLGAGLERLTMKLLKLPNIRQACFYPRDMNRVTP